MEKAKAMLAEMLHAERSKVHIERIGQWVSESPDRVAALVALFTGQPPRLAELAAWVLGDLGVQAPELFALWMPDLIDLIQKEGLHNSLYRNALRVIQMQPLPPELMGQCADACFRLFDNPNEAIAVRVFAAYSLANICQSEPELWPELLLRVEEYAIHGSPGLQSCRRKVLSIHHRSVSNRAQS